MNEIVKDVSGTARLIGDIAESSNQQAHGIAQVNRGLTQIDQVTQQNTANAEESAAAAEELSGQANELRAMLGQFKLMETHRSRPRVIEDRRSWAEHADDLPGDRDQEQLAYDDQESYNPQEIIKLDDQEFGKY